MLRTVTIFSQESNERKTLSTDASTWGALRSEINSRGLFNLSSKKIMIRENKAVLEHDEAILPEGDFTIFLFPVKVKSGQNEKVKSIREKILTNIDRTCDDIKQEVAIRTAELKGQVSAQFDELDAFVDDVLANEADEIADTLNG